MKWYLGYLGAFLVITTGPILAKTSPEHHLSGGFRVDCVHNSTYTNNGSHGCLQLSGLRLIYENSNQSLTSFRLVLDPFARPSQSLADQVEYRANPLPGPEDSSMGVISEFDVEWQFRSRLVIGFRTFGGPQTMPKVHGLALGSRFFYNGWNQTALTATYLLGEHSEHQVMFAIGNGEGEPTTNIDPQQYGALSIKYQLMDGLNIALSGSFDGNNYGSETSAWVYDLDQTNIKAGFSTQRISAAFYGDLGIFDQPGLEFAIGIQKVEAKDLDKTITNFTADAIRGKPNLTIRDLYIEDPTNQEANTVTQDVIDIGLKYPILANHFLALDYETLQVSTGKVDFFEDLDGFYHNKASLTAYGFGAGVQLDHGLNGVFEYHTESYSKDFKKFSYLSSGDKTTKTLDLFNVRIMYHW